MLRKILVGKGLIGILGLTLGVGSLSLACSSGSQSDPGALGGSAQAGNATGARAGGGSGGKTNATSGNGSGAQAGDGNSEAGAGDGVGAGGSAGAGFGGNAGSLSKGGTSNGGISNGGVSSGGTQSSVGGSTGNTVCDNGKDDDGDGLIDGLDPECTGPLDNDEDSFATGIPGDNRDPKWQDCFFDGNSGAGDDDCRYATECLTGDLPATDPDCTLTKACVDFCRPLTPNGCDCFGCCTVQLEDGSTTDILENAACSLANIDDEKACPPCVKSAQCNNTCGTCELCPGKTEADLPESCRPPTSGTGGASGSGGAATSGGAANTGGAANMGGAVGSGGASAGASNGGATSAGGSTSTTPPPSYTCDNGEQICGPGLPACGGAYYCSLGCCLLSIR